MPSFDVVSQVDRQEVRNAVDQAMRELVSRYDFKGTDSKVSLNDDGITVESASENRLDAAVDVLKSKLVRRSVSLKALGEANPQEVGGGRFRITFPLVEGLPQDAAKELAQSVRDLKLKVTASVQGDQVRVQGKKRDDLQAVIAELRSLDYRLPLQFVNMRD